MSVTNDGHVYELPARLIYDQTRWVRSRSEPSVSNGSVRCEYISVDGTRRMEFVQYAPGSLVRWSLNIYNQSQRMKTDKALSFGKEGTGIEVTYRDDFVAEPQRLFYANGRLKFEGPANLAIRHGESRGHYPNGQLWWTGRYERGAFQHEGSEFFNEDGSKISDMTWDEIEEQIRVWNMTNVPDPGMSPKEFAAAVNAA